MGLTDEEINYKEKTEFPPAEQKKMDKICDLLRMNFISKWAIYANIDLYKTDNEKDWTYIVRREYRYNVLMGSFFESFIISNLLQCVAIYRSKKIVFWPLGFTPFIGLVAAPRTYRENSRRYFETLNLGTEFELGAERNRVLEECNRLAKRADF